MFRVWQRSPRKVDRQRALHFCRVLKQLIGAVHVALRAPDSLSDDVRHFLMLASLALAIVRGILKHRVLQRGFDCIDEHDFRGWLKKHGASPIVRNSPIVALLVRLGLCLSAGWERKGAAKPVGSGGVARLVADLFDYRGGFVWKMQAGMGEAVIEPLYEVLKQREVKFKFFQRVERLELSADKTSIGASSRHSSSGFESR